MREVTPAEDIAALFELAKQFWLTGAISTAVSTFIGAYFAFQFERNARRIDLIETEVASGNRALFTLLLIWNKQKQYQKEVVDIYRNREDAWLNLAAGGSIGDSSLLFDLKELSFVLQKKGSIFQFAVLEADRFHSVSNHIDQRNKLVLFEVFPRMSAAGLEINQFANVELIRTILTAGVVRQLEVLTRGIINNIDENVASSRDVFRKFRAALKEIYPDKKFIDFVEEKELR